MAECSNVLPLPATVFRVRRKRTADPHDALIVSLKRPRPTSCTASSNSPFAPLIYQLATTSPFPEVESIGSLPRNTQLKVIDYDPSKGKISGIPAARNEVTTMESDSQVEEHPLALLAEAVGEVGGAETAARPSTSSQITLNGEPLAVVESDSNDNITRDYVFDFYWNARGIEYPPEVIEIRPAKADEVEMYMGEDTESSAAVNDDEDDSNDEANWRNDYPDEESKSEGESDSEAESVSDEGSECDDLHRRLDECDFYDSDGPE